MFLGGNVLFNKFEYMPRKLLRNCILFFVVRHLLIVNSFDDNDANPLEAFLRLTDEIVLRMSKAFKRMLAHKQNFFYM